VIGKPKRGWSDSTKIVLNLPWRSYLSKEGFGMQGLRGRGHEGPVKNTIQGVSTSGNGYLTPNGAKKSLKRTLVMFSFKEVKTPSVPYDVRGVAWKGCRGGVGKLTKFPKIVACDTYDKRQTPRGAWGGGWWGEGPCSN